MDGLQFEGNDYFGKSISVLSTSTAIWLGLAGFAERPTELDSVFETGVETKVEFEVKSW